MEARTVGGTSPFETPAFYNTLKTLADAGPGHIDNVPHGEDIDTDRIAHLVLIDIIDAQFAQIPECSLCRPLAVANKRPIRSGRIPGGKADLDCIIAVLVNGLLLNDDAWARLDNSNRYP